ncbi:uncharacterized protein LOC122313068 [Carya illinoinensis]|uniref:uncharacterized protein LOC122313068 n=1 Tax=Carya illinoinensis TaxID=32201 RepID=UPI001C71A095|nr:uncharacterized protein LOC122313068 [Carya illinoinensis]
MAFAIKKGYSSFKPATRSSFTQKHEKPYCSHCHIQGHLLANCFKAGNAQAPVCGHCNMTGHMMDKCYKLHGYPPGHKLHNKGKQMGFSANMSSLEQEKDTEEKMSFTKDQYQQLMSLLQSKEAPIANQVQTDFSSSSTMSGPFVMDHDWHG